jgi:hypothetical protein
MSDVDDNEIPVNPEDHDEEEVTEDDDELDSAE